MAAPVRGVKGPDVWEQHNCILATVNGVDILGAGGKTKGRNMS